MCYKRRRLILLKHNRVKGHWSLCSTWETASCSFLAQIFSKAVNYPAESPSLICVWAISWGTVGCVHAGSRGSPRVSHGIAGLLTDLIPHLTESSSAGCCCRAEHAEIIKNQTWSSQWCIHWTGRRADRCHTGSLWEWIILNWFKWAVLNRFPYAWLFIISKSQLEIRSKSSRRIRSQCWSTQWWKNEIFSYYLTEKLGYFTELHFGGVAKSVKWQQFICEHHWSVFASSQVNVWIIIYVLLFRLLSHNEGFKPEAGTRTWDSRGTDKRSLCVSKRRHLKEG